MRLRITHTKGPLKGQNPIELEEDVIDIGRAEECNIKFPADHNSVSRHHFTLQRQGPSYRLIAHKYAVYSGRRKVPDGTPVKSGTKLRFGHRRENELLVEYLVQDLMPTTLVQDAKSFFSAESRPIAALTALVLVLAVAGQAYNIIQLRSVESEVAAIRSEVAELRNGFIDKLADIDDSVYMLAKGDKIDNTLVAKGTAWVIAEGVLATNAHVIEELNKAKGENIYAINNAGTETVFIRISPSDTHKHPRFTSMKAFLTGKSVYDETIKRIPGYDIALIEVVTEEDRSKLGTPLATLDSSQIKQLVKGYSVAYLGYPTEGLVNSSHNPSDYTHTGEIVSTTDFFLLPAQGEEGRLVHHSIPLAGGASGSPVINIKGEVVAMISAASLFRGRHSPNIGPRLVNPVDINYAQRVDVINDFRTNRQTNTNDTHRCEWERKLAQISRDGFRQYLSWKDFEKYKPIHSVTLGEENTQYSEEFMGNAYITTFRPQSDGLYQIVARAISDKFEAFTLVAKQKGKRYVSSMMSPDDVGGGFTEIYATEGTKIVIGLVSYSEVYSGPFEIKVFKEETSAVRQQRCGDIHRF
jgi:S1-C subfamily serine protease